MKQQKEKKYLTKKLPVKKPAAKNDTKNIYNQQIIFSPPFLPEKTDCPLK